MTSSDSDMSRKPSNITCFRPGLRLVMPMGIPILSPIFSLSSVKGMNDQQNQEDSKINGKDGNSDEKHICEEPKLPECTVSTLETGNVVDLPEDVFSAEARKTMSSFGNSENTTVLKSNKRETKNVPNLPLDLDEQYLRFPFVQDLKTLRYVQKSGSKVLFILRGLPGSGKSSVVKALTAVYDVEKITVCSADHFFYQPDGRYVFDEKLLSAAHSSCQHKCKEACQNGVPVVVVDNTNVRRWEMKFYLSQANISGYVVVLVEPKTPWKLDAQELFAKTTHGVPLEVLQKKVDSFDNLIPLYYGWFINQRKSKCIASMCSRLFAECVSKFPCLRADLLRTLGVNGDRLDEDTAFGILAKYFSVQGRSSDLLHCTARFCARGKVQSSSQYHQRSDVQSSCGQRFTLTITGVLITKKTLSVRLSLDELSSALYDRPEEKEWSTSAGVPSKSKNLSPKGSKFVRPKGHTATSPNVGSGKESSNYDLSGLKGKELKKAQRALKREKKEVKRKEKQEAFFDEKDYSDDVVYKTTADCSEDLYSSDSLNTSIEQLNISGLPENQNVPKASNFDDVKMDGCGEDMNNDCCSNLLLSEDKSRSSKPAMSLSDFFPYVQYSGFSRSAHLTVKTAQRVESRETNFDVLQVCDIERRHSYLPTDFVELSGATAVYYGDGICSVYFKKPIKVHSLFSGYY